MMFSLIKSLLPTRGAWLATLVLPIALLILPCAASAQVAYRTVVLNGLPVPGLDPAIYFETFEPPWINANGQVAFFARIAGPGVQFGNEGAIFSESGGLHLVARKGDQAPGAELGATFGSLSLFPQLNAAGHIAFSADLIGPSIVYGRNSVGVWSDRSSALQKIARGGDLPFTYAAPNFSVNFFQPSINDRDEISFQTFSTIQTSFTTNRSDIWLNDGMGTSIVAGRSTPSPSGTGYLGSVSSLGLGPNGHIAFRASETSFPNDALWVAQDGLITLLARIGDPSSGIPQGELRGVSNVNALGQIAYSSNDKLWIGSSQNNLRLIAKGGDPTPGSTPAQIFHPFAFFGSDLAINDSGAVAFQAHVQSPTQAFGSAIFSEGGGQLHLVAQSGQQVPGLPAGALFGELNISSLILNNAGNVAFVGTLTGNADGPAIFAEHAGALHILVRTGGSFETSPGVFKTVSSTGFVGHFGNQVEGAGKFNDAGQLAFWASFTDGSQGIFVASLVPEIPSASLAVIALLGLTFTQRQRARRQT